jgi:hypothetical protein
MYVRGVLCVALTAVAGWASHAATNGPVHRDLYAARALSSNTASPTRSVVIRPVTHSGRPAGGFRVSAENKNPIDCSSAAPSPGSVDRNIDWCAPEGAYAIACWNAATAHHALCMTDPRAHRLYRLPLTRSFANTAAVKARSRAPLLIVLADGAQCSIIDGGAWGALKSHPNWAPYYSCSKHGIGWAPIRARHDGINEARPSWTIRTAATRKGRPTTRHVERAYFVGTATVEHSVGGIPRRMIRYPHRAVANRPYATLQRCHDPGVDDAFEAMRWEILVFANAHVSATSVATAVTLGVRRPLNRCSRPGTRGA